MEKKIYAKDGKAIIELAGGLKIPLTTAELGLAYDAIRNERGGGDFMTLYTDASHHHKEEKAQIAYKGKCASGSIEGTVNLDEVRDTNLAEMLAIEAGIKATLAKYPEVIGFSIRSDNMTCVHAFWDFDRSKYRVASVVAPAYNRIQSILDGRWTRVKHIKGHTNGKDMASTMNRSVDRMTRVRGSEMIN